MRKVTFAMVAAVVTVLGLSVACSAENDGMPSASHCIYYVPIGAETYVAVTPNNIRSYYVRYQDCRPIPKEFSELKRIILKAPRGAFDPLMVRAMVRISPSQWAFVDNYGGVRALGKDGKLTKSSLTKVKAILDRITLKRLRKVPPPRQ